MISDGQPSKLELLLPEELKRQLTDAEKLLLEQHSIRSVVAVGGRASMPNAGVSSATGSTVRVDLVRWMILAPEARKIVEATGLVVSGATFDEQLILDDIKLDGPIVLIDCVLLAGLSLNFAQLVSLSLFHCDIAKVNARYFRSTQSVHFVQSKIHEGIDLVDAAIGGDLIFLGGEIGGDTDGSISAVRLTVTGDLQLNNHTETTGNTTRLVVMKSARFGGCQISGTLVISGADFQEADTKSIDFTGSHIESGVFLKDGLETSGSVCFQDAEIGMNFNCHNASFGNSENSSLILQSANIGGDVNLGRKSKIDGTSQQQVAPKLSFKGPVRMNMATVGGGLFVIFSSFEESVAAALIADGISVRGMVHIVNDVVFHGDVTFLGASIGRDFEIDDAVLTQSQSGAFLADQAVVGGSVHIGNLRKQGSGNGENQRVTIKGDLALRGVEIRGNLCFFQIDILGIADITGSRVSSLEFVNVSLGSFNQSSLVANRVTVNGGISIGGKFRARGQISLVESRIKSTVYCQNIVVESKHGFAIQTHGSNIEGSVILTNADVKGGICMRDTNIGGHLDFRGSRIENERGVALDLTRCSVTSTLFISRLRLTPQSEIDLRSATVDQFEDDESSWPTAGKIQLDLFTYRDFTDREHGKETDRVRWLQLQPADGFIARSYTQLASVLSAAGYENKSRKVLIERERARISMMPKFPRTMHHMLKWPIHYGYGVQRATLFLLALMIMGSIIFDSAYNVGLMGPRDLSAPDFDSILYSIDAGIPFLDLNMFDNWIPTKASAKNCWWFSLTNGTADSNFVLTRPCTKFLPILNGFVAFYIMAGWLIGTLIVVSLSGLVRFANRM